MFCHRRKFLRSELLSVVKGRLDKPQVDAILAQLNLPGTLRAESLDVEQMLALCDAVRTATGGFDPRRVIMIAPVVSPAGTSVSSQGRKSQGSNLAISPRSREAAVESSVAPAGASQGKTPCLPGANAPGY